ncbi:recombinase family protein [Bradyrhizobium sp. STM 3809]|uniref:recombinase family protein n=1 Tax=Bradyrhizobium sp. STM 3809 TaxID=551936 RepID=UPI0002406AE2|nr:recombinase family protein [Bradyrhizobium sp. STM 3809]CCD97649.1 site-specific DNA recombinase; e14 prophage [Bradyrhizobium sp. STM 3809]
MIFGYARVSTTGQSLDAQVEQLKAAGAERIFSETASGAIGSRDQLRRVIAKLDAGDVLIVTRLDRLARSTRDLLNTLATISSRNAAFRSLAETWADTTTPHGRLMVTLLAGIAEFERELILERTREGTRRAKEAGVQLGRKPKLTHHQRREILARVRAGEESDQDIARSYNVSRWTIMRLAQEVRREQLDAQQLAAKIV